jgi:hypothetical protein
VVADHTKWAIVGLSSFADLDEVDTLITDSELHAEARALLAERVGQLIIADGEPAEQPSGVGRRDPGGGVDMLADGDSAADRGSS